MCLSGDRRASTVLYALQACCAAYARRVVLECAIILSHLLRIAGADLPSVFGFMPWASQAFKLPNLFCPNSPGCCPAWSGCVCTTCTSMKPSQRHAALKRQCTRTAQPCKFSPGWCMEPTTMQRGKSGSAARMQLGSGVTSHGCCWTLVCG